MTLEDLINAAHGAANKAGWWINLETGEPLQRNKAEMLCLIHSEVSECLEGIRKDCMDDHLPHRKMEEVELADVVIRIADYCGGFNIDLEGAIKEKMKYNAQRADHKMSNRLKEGGKKI
jgi:NTP pyrophosphatase (non-canonical NTP hydrolase)